MSFDVHDREDLKRSLNKWHAELTRSQKHLTASQRASEEARRHLQQVQATIERRERQLAKVAPHGPRRKAVEKSLSFVGTKEKPAGSNRGLLIDLWQGRFHMRGQPWCGAFVGAMIEFAGGNVTDRIVYTPYIYEDANVHRNGLDGIVWRDRFMAGANTAHSGDVVLFDFGTSGIKHVAMLVKPWSGKGLLQTVEGNTSFGSGGSQDNGGAVARRQRDVSLVHSIVKVQWPH